jgi:diguanylate cyclase (GGDEF)-like protein
LRSKHSVLLTEQEQQRQTKWMNWYMRIYWLAILVHFLAQLGSYLFLPYPATAKEFYLYALIYPTLVMAAINGATHLVMKLSRRGGFYAIFSGGTMVSAVIIHVNADIRIIGAIMLLPILASTTFYRIKLTLMTAAFQLAAIAGLYYFNASFRNYTTHFDLIAYPLFLLMATIIALFIILRGRELASDLREMLLAKQALMIENTIMQQRSKTDALTKLFNHISFHEFFELAIQYAGQETPFHLAIVDIDNFKQINDNYGHQTGDLILARVSDLIRAHMSPVDIPARYGGEEFALLLFDQTFMEAYNKMERLRRELSFTKHSEIDGKAVTVSIGLKSWTPGDTKESLFEEADSLLYMAKRSGKNKTATP